MALNLKGRVEISVGELRGGRQSRERKWHRREEPEDLPGRASGWIPRWYKRGVRRAEVERPRGKIIGGPAGHGRV